MAVATGLVGTSVPIFLLNHCLAVVPVSTAALILTLIPVFAVVTAIALLGEPLMLLNGLRGAIIIAGLVILHRWRPEAQQAPTI